MNKHIHLLYTLILISFLWFWAEDAHAQSLRVLPLGNSITEGWDLSLTDGEKGAYRSHLYTLLNDGGYTFDFVGHDSTGFDVFPKPAHGGIPGTRDQWLVTLLQNGYDERNSIQITPGNEPYLDIYPADIILLHIGTNDMTHEASADPSQVAAILDEIDAWEAANGIELAVFVARIINRIPYSLITTQYNDAVEAMVALRGDPNLFMVDMENGAGIIYGPPDMQSDGLHVEEAGYIKMGQAWFDALDPFLSSVPDAPTALTATALDASSIQLSWTENSANESGYRVERSESSGSGFSQIALLASNTTTYTDNVLEEGTQYFYRVQAYNNGGFSGDSNEASATTAVTLPDAPTNLNFGTITSSSIQLIWTDNSDNEDGFEIYMSTGGSYSSVGTTGAGISTFTHSGLSENTQYFYRVVAYNAAGASSPASGSATTSQTPPAAPSNLTFGTITSNSIQLNWVDNSNNENGFEIFRSTRSNSGFVSVALTSAGVTSYISSGLDADQRYYFRVSAFNAGGSSAYISGNASTLPDPPSAPSNLTFAPITANSITLNWSDNSGNEDGFEIFRALSAGGPYTSLGTTLAGVETYTHTGLTSNTRYYYRVSAFNAGGSSSYASGSAVTLPTVPSAPSNLTFTSITSNSIRLNWSDNSNNEDGFEIFRSTSSGGTFVSVGTTGSGVETFNNTGLSAGTEYFYRVYAFNSGGSSLTYASGSESTLPLPPVAPSNLTFGTVTSSSIQLNWTDNSENEDGFEIYRSLFSWGLFSSIGTTAAGVTTFNSTGLTSNTTYYYRVYAFNAGGNSSYVSGNERTLPDVPAAPSNLSFGTITNTSIQLNWTDNSTNEDGFEIYRALSATGTYSSVATVGPGVTTYTNTGLSPATAYFYRVYAFNGGGVSTPVSGNTQTLPDPPAAPSNLRAGTITTSSIQLLWNDNSFNEDRFDIYYSLSAGGPWALVTSTGPGITTYTHAGLEDDTEYFYQVYAVNTGGTSTPTTGSFTTLLQVPDAPTSLSATANNACAADLKWLDNSDNESGFEIERSSVSSTLGFAVIQTLGPDAESYADTSARNQNTYYYRVRAFNAAGYSDYSNTQRVTLNVVLDGGAIGADQSICPLGDADLLFNVTSPSGGSNNWSYQWQSRSLAGTFANVDGATQLTYNPPAGMMESTEFQRMSTVECGSVFSNVVTITVEDLENPVFDLCPLDVIALIGRDQTMATVLTEDPVLSDNCGIEQLTWTVSGASTGASPETGIHNLGTFDFNLGLSTVTYRAVDLSGNFSECAFTVSVEFSPPEILQVSIPDAVMKIGDIVTATISTATDGGSPFSMVSGEIGGYPLYNFQRIDETTYLANFEIVENGNSYLAAENIPVSNLILTDGSMQSLPYNLPIVQGNDLLDALLPVVNGVAAETGIYSIGDMLNLTISADGLLYTIHPSSTVNGVAASEPNMFFTELGGGIYRLSYLVQEGDTDVAPGELQASVVLVKPSGNIGLPYTEIANTASVAIDAHAPVITGLEVPDVEVGVGGTVQVTITADEGGYVASVGTLINGIPLSSPRVTFSERAGGLYELSYVVDAGDAEVAPGDLNISMVMTDPSGNANVPYILVEENTLEIYTDLPVALLVGTPEICEEEAAELTVFLEGREPWSFDLYDGTDTLSYENVSSSVFDISVAPLESTSYRILTVTDVNKVVNVGSGTVSVTVNEKTPVQIINLASGYLYDADPVKLEADVPGGTFSGPGVFSGTGYFDPGVADTINSPHTIYYTYVNANGCKSVDSALVFVLGANGGIYIPSSLVCQNGDPFTVNASNISGVTGTFVLLDSTGQAVDGLVDNGDNSAEINPGQLMPGEYTIQYEYVDLSTLYLTRTFVVETVDAPAILNLEDVYCQNVDPFLLESDMEGVVFGGQGVAGTIATGFVFDPGAVSPGQVTIFCTATSDNGCEAATAKTITIEFAPAVDFALSRTCIADTGGVVQFENLTDGKLEVETWSWDFGDPASGENNTSGLVNPEHYYATPGEVSVSLTATAFNGCVSERIRDISIGNHVTADFTWTSDCYAEDSQIQFLDLSTSGNSEIDTVIWRFRTPEGELLDEIVSGWGSANVQYQFASAGDYVVELVASNNMGCTDSTRANLSLRETIKLSTADYQETFNQDQGAWTVHSEDQLESWTWNVPDFDGFVPQAGDNAWFTRLPENALDYQENSWVQSPCFDFSGIKKPMISMDIMRSFVPERDGAVLQYLVDRQDGWQTVGDIASGIEWYNSANITNEPGGSQTGWSLEVFNPDQEWVSVAHDLDRLAQAPNAMLRIVLGSNGQGVNGNQGFAFDNVAISQRTKMAVIEHFTNSADEAAFHADAFMDDFVKANSSDVVDIQYHMSSPGTDPMNANNPAPAATRSFNYGIPSVPYAVLNGGVGEEDRFDFSDLKSTLGLEKVLHSALQKPEFSVDLEVAWNEGGLGTSTLVTCEADRYDDNIQLYLVVFETSVTQYTGINGDTAFRNVVLDMLPSTEGKLLGGNWSRGDDDFRENTWTYPSYVEHTDDLAVIAFVQNRNTYQILQADVSYKTPQDGVERNPYEVESLHIYPNPAKDQVHVNLGRPAEKDGRFEIIDMNGRVVHNENVPRGYQIYQLEVGSLNRGFYMIQWYEGGILKGRNKLITVD